MRFLKFTFNAFGSIAQIERFERDKDDIFITLREILNTLKLRKSKMEEEMKIVENCLSHTKPNLKNVYLPKELVGIICGFTWDISRLSHRNWEV